MNATIDINYLTWENYNVTCHRISITVICLSVCICVQYLVESIIVSGAFGIGTLCSTFVYTIVVCLAFELYGSAIFHEIIESRFFVIGAGIL